LHNASPFTEKPKKRRSSGAAGNRTRIRDHAPRPYGPVETTPAPTNKRPGRATARPPGLSPTRRSPDRPPSQTHPNTVNGNRQQKRSPKLWSSTQTPANLHPKPKLTPFGLPNRKIRKPGLTGRRTGDHTPPS